MSHKFPEREFVDKGFSRAAVEWLRDINSTALGTISLDTTEVEALVHEFRTLKVQFDELKFQNEQLLNGLPDQIIEDMSKNVIVRDPTTAVGMTVNSEGRGDVVLPVKEAVRQLDPVIDAGFLKRLDKPVE